MPKLVELRAIDNLARTHHTHPRRPAPSHPPNNHCQDDATLSAGKARIVGSMQRITKTRPWVRFSRPHCSRRGPRSSSA
eukprot:3158923-Pyramimonas_sp.AAC.1